MPQRQHRDGVMLDFLKKMWGKGHKEPPPVVDVEELQATFRSRYHHFKLLLGANNKALELMADMERALHGSRPFGMSFIRANCTAISANVFQIVKHLNELESVKYRDLHLRFRDIQGHISELLAQKEAPRGDRLTVPLGEVDKEMSDVVGSKMANLGEILNHIRQRVSPGFVITALAYHRFMEHNRLQEEIDRRLQATVVDRMDQLFALSAALQQLIIAAQIPADVERAIMAAYSELESRVAPGVRVSLRSSALGEDLAGTSFAGQYRSELNVSAEHILSAYKEIIASKYGISAMSYRLNRGIRDEDIAMSVGCMAMVNAVAGGVMYSRDPLNIRGSSVLINAVWGLPKSVVDGSVTPDAFVVSRDPPRRILAQEIQLKERKFVCYPDEGVCRLDLTGESGALPSLSAEQALQLAEIAMQLEDYYGCAQDIEWAIDAANHVYLLQCRPLQQLETGDRPQPGRGGATYTEAAILHGGATASPGIACGPVFILQRDMDALHFPRGAVLVTAQSLPRWASLLNRAAAVVTEQGSVTGHLANVAREFGVPALFGMPKATQSLSPGQLVTVDADDARVYRGRIEPLLALRAEPRKSLMEGSPVHDLLRKVSEHIVPLHLLDPDAVEFAPRNCRTFHDITRFAHEKSVQEMFSFGRQHHFSERSSKQLVYKVPMQFWVINLDDGFAEDVQGPYVDLANIVCIPMLALWRGMIAIPWQGPPAVDTKGFMSVLLQATTNPALDPALRSRYAARNYFMISRNFCSLVSRFGFHFSTVETLVSDRSTENYISFQFKGGAADYPRRVRRALFIGDILKDCGFRCDIKADAMFARAEGMPQLAMTEKLRILGYLIMHTRQLDMIMSSEGVVHHHRNRIRKDIEAIVRGDGNEVPEVQQ